MESFFQHNHPMENGFSLYKEIYNTTNKHSNIITSKKVFSIFFLESNFQMF